MTSNQEDRSAKSIYGTTWDNYIENYWPKLKRSSSGQEYEWPGDEWGSPSLWENVYQQLFVPAGVKNWQRAVEIGPGAGKYTSKVLADSSAVVRAYDVSAKFLEVCETRCEGWIEQSRLSLHLLDTSRTDQMLSDLKACNWQRSIDAFYSIDAMVHVDLQYLIVYLLTASLSLKPGGKLILTLADVTTELGFMKLLKDIKWAYPHQGGLIPKFEWLSPDIVHSILRRLGFEIELYDRTQRDQYVLCSLTNPRTAEALAQYILPQPQYQQLTGRIREVVHSTLPPEATIIVVNKGDDGLLKLGSRQQGWHFPQDEDGAYAGYYPADDAEAIARLEKLRNKGGDFYSFLIRRSGGLNTTKVFAST